MKTMDSVETDQTLAAFDDARWQALHEGRTTPDPFYYAVKTTGIFCRPGCRSRLPKRANVLFFATPAEALAAGFRPCKRCQPATETVEQDLARRLSRACRILEHQSEDNSVASVARAVGLSSSHFHRLFKRCLGVTPKAYASMHRINHFKHQLHWQANVTAALHEAGFNSSSRAYDRVGAKLGMTPRQFSKGGHGVRMVFAVQKTSLGWVLIARSEQGVCSIDIADNSYALRKRLSALFPQAKLEEDNEVLAPYMHELLRYLETPRSGLQLPLDIRGTAFQRRVWAALREIPPGRTLTYRQLARKIGRPSAVRAVAGACAANTLALAVPCHRAVRQDGRLGGYRWGLSRKRALLRREKSERLQTNS